MSGNFNLVFNPDQQQEDDNLSILLCDEQMPSEEFSFLEYLKFHQLSPMSDEARSKLMTSAFRDLCEALDVFSAGGSVIFVKISTDTNRCKDCRGSEQRRLYIEPGLATVVIAAIVQQDVNYCEVCKVQLFVILTEMHFFRYFID